MNNFDTQFKDVSDFILKYVIPKRWKWFNNTRCKYIEIRMDTRSGECQLKDRNGEFITLGEFMMQYESNDIIR